MASLYESGTAVAYAESVPTHHSPIERRKEITATTFRELDAAIARAEEAQERFAALSGERVDAIFKAACRAVNKAWMVHVGLDGFIHGERPAFSGGAAPEYRHYFYAAEKTPRPLHVGIVPASNPALTAIWKSLDAIRSRKSLILSAYPRITQRIADAADSVYWAAVETGAPEGFLCCAAIPGVNLPQVILFAGQIFAQPVHDAYARPPANRETPGKTPVTLLGFCPLR